MVREQTIKAAANMLEADVADIELEDGARRGRRAPTAKCRSPRSPPPPTRCATPSTERPRRRPSSRPQAAMTARRSSKGSIQALRPPTTTARACATWAYGVHGAIVEVDRETLHGQDPEIRLHPRLRQHDQPDHRRRPGDGRLRAGHRRRALRAHRIRPGGQPAQCQFRRFPDPLRDRSSEREMLHLETPSPLNPLGVKGVGEAGCIAVGAVDRVRRRGRAQAPSVAPNSTKRRSRRA